MVYVSFFCLLCWLVHGTIFQLYGRLGVLVRQSPRTACKSISAVKTYVEPFYDNMTAILSCPTPPATLHYVPSCLLTFMITVSLLLANRQVGSTTLP